MSDLVVLVVVVQSLEGDAIVGHSRPGRASATAIGRTYGRLLEAPVHDLGHGGQVGRLCCCSRTEGIDTSASNICRGHQSVTLKKDLAGFDVAAASL